MKTHIELDTRSLALHRLVAEKIRSDPLLLDRVRQTLSRWYTLVSPSSLPYVNEWQRLVELGVDDCLAVAVEDSPRATALRQSSPFTGILSNKERFVFFRSWGQKHEAR